MNASTPTTDPVDDYIAAFPADVQSILQQIRATIRAAAPDAQEMIKYNMPAYVLDGFLVSFAAYKKHIGIYPAPDGDEEFNARLVPYRAERSTVRLPLNKPIPYDLVTDIVSLRVAQQRKR